MPLLGACLVQNSEMLPTVPRAARFTCDEPSSRRGSARQPNSTRQTRRCSRPPRSLLADLAGHKMRYQRTEGECADACAWRRAGRAGLAAMDQCLPENARVRTRAARMGSASRSPERAARSARHRRAIRGPLSAPRRVRRPPSSARLAVTVRQSAPASARLLPS